MQSGLVVLIFLCIIALTVSAFHMPLVEVGENYEGQLLNKRNFYENNQFKRKFNADDLTLRFGKRSEMAFQPEQLSLRFGRR